MQTGCNGFKLYLALNVTFLAFYSSRHNSCLLLLITVDLDCASAFFGGGRGGWGRGKGVALKLPKCFFYQLHYDKFIYWNSCCALLQTLPILGALKCYIPKTGSAGL